MRVPGGFEPVSVVEDAVVRQHANEDVEEGRVDVRHCPNLFRGQRPISPGEHQRRDREGLVEEDQHDDLH